MRSSVTRQVTNSRWQRLTMDKPDCFALMLEDESQAECTFSAIKLEEVVIVPSRWRQKAMVYGDASRWRNSLKSSCVRMHGVPSHVPRDRPVLMKSISIPTFSLEAIHKRGSEATVAATSVPERCAWSRSSVGYDALGARGDPRGRKFGGGPVATNPR